MLWPARSAAITRYDSRGNSPCHWFPSDLEHLSFARGNDSVLRLALSLTSLGTCLPSCWLHAGGSLARRSIQHSATALELDRVLIKPPVSSRARARAHRDAAPVVGYERGPPQTRQGPTTPVDTPVADNPTAGRDLPDTLRGTPVSKCRQVSVPLTDNGIQIFSEG